MAENIENKDPLRLTPTPENGAVKTYERKKNVAASGIKETTLEISYDILDEADNITAKAQRLINSIMEKYPTTRFAFTCNNS